MHSYWGDIFATLMLGSLMYLAFEVPFKNIYEYYKKRKPDNSNETPALGGPANQGFEMGERNPTS